MIYFTGNISLFLIGPPLDSWQSVSPIYVQGNKNFHSSKPGDIYDSTGWFIIDFEDG